MKVVQIGSNKGNDDLSNYLKKTYKELEFGLFVEANSLHIDELKNCYQQYSNVAIENVAIKTPSDSNHTLTLYYRVDDAPGYCVASCIKEHVEGHTALVGEMRTFSVPSITLDELFQKHQITDLDWLLLDIEGIDVEILLSTNWARYNIKRIDYERIHLGDKKEEIEQMFINLGYQKVPGLQYVYDDGWIRLGAKNTEEITHYAISKCEEGYGQQKGNFYYLKPIFDYYYQTQNAEKLLKYGEEFLIFSKPYQDEYRVSIFIQCSESFYKLGNIQSSVNYAFHALSEAICLGEPYISQAFSYFYSLSVKVNNPNLIIFASGFSSQTLNTKERKEAIKTLANDE